MPGTHYDNDHSFIEDLPFDYRLVASLLIREYPLKSLMLYAKEQEHELFEPLLEIYPKSHAHLKQQTFWAVMVAKLTFFAKDCYITDREFEFLRSNLLENLRYLLDAHDLDEKSLIKTLRNAHYKSFDWLTRDRDESRRYALEIRKRRKNDRRYFRYRAYVNHHFVRLGNHELDEPFAKDIHTSGIVHFSKIVNQKLDFLTQQYQHQIKNALAEVHPSIYQLFKSFFAHYEDLREILNGVSLGRLSVVDSKKRLKKNLEAKRDFSILKMSQKTQSMLHDFKDKLNQITHHTLVLLENSTPHKLYQGPPLEKLKVDFDIKTYLEMQALNNRDLLGAFISLYFYSSLLERIYNNIASSEFIIMFPEYWADNYKNISSGGFAFYSEFQVFKNDILEIMLRVNISTNPDEPEYVDIQQKAKVVRIEEDESLGQYLIACQFLLAEEKNLKLINHSIQGFEVREAFECCHSVAE